MRFQDAGTLKSYKVIRLNTVEVAVPDWLYEPIDDVSIKDVVVMLMLSKKTCPPSIQAIVDSMTLRDPRTIQEAYEAMENFLAKSR